MMDGEDDGVPVAQHADPLAGSAPARPPASAAKQDAESAAAQVTPNVYDRPLLQSPSFGEEANSADVVKAAEQRRQQEESLLQGQDGEAGTGELPLRFKVCEPRMALPESPIELAYWMYTVVTKSAMPDWAKKDLKVSHRFSDFVWLRDEVVQDHPGIIVPPLPEQQIKGQLEKVVLNNVNLLNFRQRALTKFLNAVGAHSTLQQSPLLKGFCELEGAEFEAFRQQRKRDRAETGPTKMQVLSQKTKDGWFRMFGSKDKAQQEVAQQAGGQSNHQLEQRRTHASLMEQTMGVLRDRLRARVDALQEVHKAMTELGSILTRTGDLEGRVDASLGDDFRNIGGHAEALGRLQKDQADKETLLVLELMGFYVGTYKAIKDVAARLQRYELTMLNCMDELSSATAAEAKAKDRSKAEKTKQDKQAAYHKAREKFERCSGLFDAEWARFHARKRHDLRQMQKVFIELQVSFLRQTEQLEHPPITDPNWE
eukprot:TRINITY_DN56220_c0_g1_i1.p1 TRINITY_DN56220_c0_g1~~TRINITY_DN56220_c0_g1_i1.p1  ORF type:complete len:512 (+),score=173.42 TRINITY_DN56220_c0_g1_i1:86-1537(+)